MTHEVIKALHDVDIYEIAYCKKLFYGIGRHREEKGQGYALLEFGAIFICPRRLVELGSYSTLICPRDLSAISQVSVRCNGITRESVAAEPAFEQVADRVYDMLHERNKTGELVGQIEEAITCQLSELSTLSSSVDVNKVRQALKSSYEKLRKVVVDPLPSALGRAVDVQSMIDESAATSDSCENTIQTCASELGPSLRKDVQNVITDRNADKERNGIQCPSLPHHDLIDIIACIDEVMTLTP